jgi:hypothetical protein
MEVLNSSQSGWALPEFGRVLEVPSGAEGVALAGDHQDELILRIAEALPGVVELPVHLPADGVSLLGAVVGEHGDVPLVLVAQGLVVHFLSFQHVYCPVAA